VARTRTDIEAPHVFETPFVIAAAEYPSHIVRKGDGVRAKAVSRERAPYRSLAPIHHWRGRRLDVKHIREMGDRTKPWSRVWDRGTGRLGDRGGERR
jgi:hypothetical protein